MPEINLADSRRRDAVVQALPVRVQERLRWVGPAGGAATERRILKSTVEHDPEAL
jgi:hypothetical protein